MSNGNDEQPPYDDGRDYAPEAEPRHLAQSAFTTGSTSYVIEGVYSMSQLSTMEKMYLEYQKLITAYQQLIIAVRDSLVGLREIKDESRETHMILSEALRGLKDAISKGVEIRPIDL